jgi:hypothetical protein
MRDYLSQKGFGALGIILLIAILVATGAVGYLVYRERQSDRDHPMAATGASPKRGFINGTTTALKIKPNRGQATAVEFDFNECSRGSEDVAFGFGSTSFAFEGIVNGSCNFYLGTEIENPRWDGALDTKCEVPININTKEFPVTANGIQFGDFIAQYCKELS